MFEYEDRLLAQGYGRIAGTDEAGIGPLAGPIVAATVVLDLQAARSLQAPLQLKTKIKYVRIQDSKKCSPAEREALFPVILANCLDSYISFVHPPEINTIQNILQAGDLARFRSASQVVADYHLCDHFTIPNLSTPCLGITKGDAKSISIAAASILAKVTRDRWMNALAQQHPQYEWDKNKGYFSEAHIEAIRKYGVTPYHKTYYGPIKRILSTPE